MNPIFQFLLVLLLAVFAGLKVTIHGALSRKHIHSIQDNLWFNALLSVIIAVLMALIFSTGKVTGTIALYAALSGACNIVFQYCYSIALKTGPVSLSTLITNFNVLIITAFSCIFLGDKLYPPQLVAVGLLTASMILSTQSKPNEKKATRKWLILPLICMAAGAMDGILQKLFLRTPDAQLPNAQSTQLALGYLISALIAFALYFTKARKEEKSTLGFKKNILLYTLAIGLILTLYRRINLFALTVVDATFLFPTYAGLSSLIMMFIGMIFFKDRLTKRQIAGILCGIASVVLMNIRIGMPIG